MTNRPSGKSYVDRADILANENLAPEIRAILVCIDGIDAKLLPLVVWLVASGENGLNAHELKELTGFGLATVEGAAQRLIELGLVKSLPPIFPAETGRYAIVPGLGGSPRETKPVGIGKTGVVVSEVSKNTSSVLTQVSKEGDSLSSVSYLTTLPQNVGKRKIKRKRLKAPLPQQTEQSSGVNPDDDACTEIRKMSENAPGSKPPSKRQKTKKLKRSDAGSGRSGREAFADDLKAENKRRYRRPVNYGAHVENPSENPALTQWKTKHQPNRWRGPDWVGYWLHKWRECYGEEDPTFKGQRFIKSSKRSRERGEGRVDVYWETAFKIEAFRDNDRAFRGDGQGLKDFIDWLFDDFVPGADWLDTPVTVSQIFRPRNNRFLERFKVRSIKVKNSPKKKGKGKWRHWGWDPEG